MFKMQQPSSSDSSDSAKKRNFWRRIFPFRATHQTKNLRENLTNALTKNSHKHSKDAEVFTPEERRMLNNILELGQAHIGDIMVPRSEIEALRVNATLGEALEKFEKSGYSRMPVYLESLDEPCGMIHMRDILNYLTHQVYCHKKDPPLNLPPIDLKKPINSLNIIRNVLFVPSSMLASKLLTRMQATRTQMALVIDEHGGTDGLVSMEDIVELIVGDIEDEHDDETPMIYKEREHSWFIDARADLKDVQETLGNGFHINSFGEDVDTIGGLIVSMLDRIPTRGEHIEVSPGFRFRIVEADKRRIKKLRVRHITESALLASSPCNNEK